MAEVAGALSGLSAFDPSVASSAESLSFFRRALWGAEGAVWAALSLPGLLSVRNLHTRAPCGHSTRWQFCK